MREVSVRLTHREIKVLLNILSYYLDLNSQGEISKYKESIVDKIGNKLYTLSMEKSDE